MGIAALMIVGCNLAQAHTYPTHRRRGGATVTTTSQNDVTIDFDDDLELAFSSVGTRDR
ncbi:MAG TPA: hypothetical protein VJU59_33290 [Paraburkholderia sp.]|uniref:hypothetical protein n=1 Tax=Paraburkholderia sp. TaxID=1926495 RepID=UPI002B49406B|nr:hypothetical protein [Paraburkholderia sp.]HKR44493.1 hypothetical protein [Paraburkholderia sp.]